MKKYFKPHIDRRNVELLHSSVKSLVCSQGARVALCLIVLIFLLLPSVFSPQNTGPADAKNLNLSSSLSGQTATLLPDGRLLLIGGKTAEGLVANAFIRDAVSSSTTQVADGLHQPRAWHSATLLPDGTVLVWGGIGTNGIVSGAELFHPKTQTFEPFSLSGLTPRAYHTATVLSDGRVLGCRRRFFE